MASELKGAIHIVGGELPAVGKSVVSRLLCEWLGDGSGLVDADPKQDAGCYFDNRLFCSSPPSLPEAAYWGDEILQFAIDGGLAVVNLPPHCWDEIQAWWQAVELFDLASREGINLWLWWVAGANAESMKLFMQSLETYGSMMPHILVKNRQLFNCWDVAELSKWQKFWSELESRPAFKDSQMRGELYSFELPKLFWVEMQRLSQDKIKFTTAINLKEATGSPRAGCYKFFLMSRSRYWRFVNKAFTAISAILGEPPLLEDVEPTEEYEDEQQLLVGDIPF